MVRGNFTKYDGENGTSNATNRAASLQRHRGAGFAVLRRPVLRPVRRQPAERPQPQLRQGRHPPRGQGAEPARGPARSPGVSYGEVSFLPIISTNDRKEIGDTLSYLLDKHVLKGGVDYNDTGIDQVFKGQLARRLHLQQQGRPPRRPLGPVPAVRRPQRPDRRPGGPGEVPAEGVGGFFLQDQWFLLPNLTLTARRALGEPGQPERRDPQPQRPNANGSFNLTGHVPDSNNNISPRLSISWAPDEKTALRGSVGRYWSRTPAILFAQLFTSNGIRGTQYIILAPQTGGVVTGPPTDPLSPGLGSQLQPRRASRRSTSAASRTSPSRASPRSTPTSTTPTPTASRSAPSGRSSTAPPWPSTSPTPRPSSSSA